MKHPATAARPATAPGPGVAVIASAAQFMVVLDSTIVNVALPSMRRALGFGDLTQQWIITSYLLVFGGLLLLGGRAADQFGRRRVFLAGLGLFSAASLLGGLAPTGSVLIAARAAQGLGAAMLAPAPMALIATTYPEGPHRARAIGMWSATAAAAGTAGVVLGGVLTQFGDWRWVMFVNVPIGVTLAVTGRWALPPDEAGSRPRSGELDLPGAITVTAGLAALVFAVAGVGTVGWTAPRTLGTLIAGVVLLGVFALVELRSARPLLPGRIVRSRGVLTGNAAMALTGGLTSATVLFLALFLQEVHGYDPLHGGLALLPMTIVIAGVSTQTRRVLARLGPRGTLACGALIMAAGLVWQSRFTPDSPYVAGILLPQLVIGLGLGLQVLPITTVAIGGVGAADAGLAAALINTTRQLGGSVAVAVLTTAAAAVTAAAATPRPTALTSGYSTVLLVCAGLAVALAALTPAFPRAE